MNYRFILTTFILLVSLYSCLHDNNKIKDDIDHKLKENTILLEKQSEIALINLRALREEAIKAKYVQGELQSTIQIVKILFLSKGEFEHTIEELKYAEKLAQKSKDYRSLITIYIYRSGVYFQLGLFDIGYETLTNALTISNKITDNNIKNLKLASIYANMAIYYQFKKDNINAVQYMDKGLASLEKTNNKSEYAEEKTNINAVLTHARAGLYYKNNQIDSAKVYYLKSYKIFDSKEYKGPVFAKMDLVKSLAYFFYYQKDYRSAIKYANLGIKEGEQVNATMFKNIFYNVLHQSYLQTNQIDSSKFYYDLYSQSNKNTTAEVNSGLKSTFDHQGKQMESNYRQRLQQIIFIISIFLIIIGCGIRYWIKKSRLRINQKYEILINKLSHQQMDEKEKIAIEIPSAPIEIPINLMSIISEETVNSLLKKLEKFEKLNKFTKQDVTLGSLANDWNTNTRYMSEIIKEYRGKNFSNYINGLRIEFITKKLYEDPQYRKYKIAYLASQSGFSSGTVFTNIFKKETGMTPSYFISQLEKQDEQPTTFSTK